MVEIVGALLVRRGAVLMGRRAAWKTMLPNCWDVIGGHVEPGETPYDTLVREVAEEVGVRVTEAAPMGQVTYLLPGRGPLVQDLFHVSAWVGEPTLANDEHTELRWFTREALAEIGDDAFREYRPLLERLLTKPSPAGPPPIASSAP
jgi:8-oxo-dGTP diphosphatase